MTGSDLVKYARRLHSRVPLLGTHLRRSACRKLAEDASASAVPHLIVALHADDPEVWLTAEAALRGLRDASAVDTLCARWAQGRDPGLGAIIAERGYVARKPVAVRVLSALQANRLEVAGESAATPQSLVAILQDRDTGLAARAEAALRQLAHVEVIDALCELVIADPDSAVAAIVKEIDYQPQSVSRRCVLFLLTGQLERYLELDFEFQYLRAEYQVGDEGLRQRIGNVIRRSGDTRLIGLFRASRQRKLASELTEAEAAIVLDVHARNRQWSEIFALLFHIPLASAVVALDVLSRSGWRPQNNVEATLLDELFAVRAAIDDMSGEFLVPYATFSPVLTGWMDCGRSPEWRSQSPDALRKTLSQAPPPEAVAALVALVTARQSTVADLQAACTHQHWLVRLAALAFSHSTPMPTNGEGGELWLTRLAPAITGFQCRAVNFTPDQLATLQATLAAEDDRSGGRWACGRLLETLARHHLRHTIEVDEQMSVEVSDTAIEIEMEG